MIIKITLRHKILPPLRLASLVAMLLMPVSLLAGNNEPVITLETGGGEAGCWMSYKMEIFKDGKVHWLGLSYVHVKGHRYKRIGKRKVAALLKKFDEAKFFEITNNFTEREAILAKIKTPGFVLPPKGSPELARMDRAFVIHTDASVFNITLNTGGRKKTISYYGGGEEGELERATWQAVPGSKKWLFPASDPWQSGCKEDH